MANGGDEPTIKELLAGAQLEGVVKPETQAALERWLRASAAPKAEPVPEPVDPQLQAVIERRERALAAVDPKFVEAIEYRYEIAPASLIKFEVLLDVRMRDDMPLFDYAMTERLSASGEPHEYEIPEEMRDQLRETSPQALLRDLHRLETEFSLELEVVDIAANQRLDIVAAVQDAMATCWALPPLGPAPFEEERRLLERDRTSIYRTPWIEISMPNRTVTE